MRNTTTHTVLLVLLLFSNSIIAKSPSIDSSWSKYEQTSNYAEKLYLLEELATHYHSGQPDSTIFIAEQTLQLAQILGHQEAEIRSLNLLAYVYWKCQDLDSANLYAQNALQELDGIESPILKDKTRQLGKNINLTQTYVSREKASINLLSSKIGTLRRKGFAWQVTALSLVILSAIALWWLKKYLTKIYETKLQKKEADIKEALEKVDAAEKVQKELIQTISHEINTPMNAIVGFSELMMLPEMEEEEKMGFLESVLLSCNKLARITGSLLDYSVLLADQLTVTKKTVDLEELLAKIWKKNNPNAFHKGLELSLQIPQTKEPLFYKTDILKLEKVLYELVDNAIKYTQNGKVTLGYTVGNRSLEFFVKDSGIGISKTDQKDIFHRFKRGASSKYDTHGVGLGLTICKQLVEVMDGELYFDSKLTKGSTFYVRMPFFRPESNAIA